MSFSQAVNRRCVSAMVLRRGKICNLGGASKIEVYEVIVNEGETHQDAINRIVASAPLEKGSIAIVKELIASDADKHEYTAYIYNGTDWAAMDGNYSAENTFFSADLTYTEPLAFLKNPLDRRPCCCR